MDSALYSDTLQNIYLKLKPEGETVENFYHQNEEEALECIEACKSEIIKSNKKNDLITQNLTSAKKAKYDFSNQFQQVLSNKEKIHQNSRCLTNEKNNLENKLSGLKRQRTVLTEEKSLNNILENYRKCLLSWKILTRTYFDFGESVSGFTITNDYNYKCFEFKNKQEDQQLITNYLWKNLEECSK